MCGTILMRGRFVVTDPTAAGDLNLAMEYRGSAVVYLNGREVARVHMPPGPITVDTDAEP
ncbi:MAG: hypothetical protein ACUVWX_07040 [Kiritimatiellia bacterium]